MEAQSQARVRAPLPALRPPPLSFDKQKIHDAMNEHEREESRRIESSESGSRRFDSLLLASNVVFRLEKESPEKLYPAESQQSNPTGTSGQQQIYHGPTSGSEHKLQDRRSRERTLSDSPAPSSRGSNRTPLPGHSSSKLSAPPPPPDSKDATQPRRKRKMRVAKSGHQNMKPNNAKNGNQTRYRDTTNNENMRAAWIRAEGIINPYGPCGPCKNSPKPCMIPLDGRMRCAKCTKSKAGSKDCLSGQYDNDPSILEAAKRAAASRVGLQPPSASHHHRSLGGSNDPQLPEQIDSNETDHLPG